MPAKTTKETLHKKPAMGTKSQLREETLAESKQIGFTRRLKGSVVRMPLPRMRQVFVDLSREAAEIVLNAQAALEEGNTTFYAQSQLRTVIERLKKLEFEYRGGCSW